MKSLDTITGDVLEEFLNRKTEGRIDFVVDVRTNDIYPVPKNIEHSEFIPRLPRYAAGTSYYVPIQLRFEGEELSGVLTGASSYEDVYCVQHTMGELCRARDIIWGLIIRSDIKINIKRDEILKDYVKSK